ncbi:MAG: MFS transporter [Pseudomonadota bacterium]|nr:MFS transporter [Pseudomonadota bacterium]MEC7437877.1 MFS transporter [Pseudomonadota bacterium]MEC7486152.1 MFS transporter [Pseudomonadota bacterium]MEC7558826.1 MFS transporter [Pseudomonadota bacterium]MEC7615372.1 MFS transporter [Pseudomonadota bacterium]
MNVTNAIRSKTISDIWLNISHFLDHFIMLVFAKAAYDAGRHFGMSYEEIIVYGVAGFVLFGGMAPVAAQMADRYSRSLMMVVYHFGIGIAAVLAGLAQSVWQLGAAIGLIGVFAAIYHPVGIAMLIKSNRSIGFRLGINGVFGNMGVAAAPLIIGLLLTVGDWRLCFIASGLFCIGYGVVFILALVEEAAPAGKTKSKMATGFAPGWKIALGSMLLSTASGGFIFGAMTFVVPRYFEISLPNVSTSVAITGLLASIVYAAASFSQIGVGWLIDRVAPKWVLFSIGVGQVIFVALAARFTDYALFFAMLVAMCFVFGQIPITDTILSRYVPDNWRARVLSVKFMVNLTIGATVLPICGAILQSGYEMAALFSVMSILAVFVVIAGALLPVQADAQRLDRVPAE